jgi:hypothetical protein
MSDETPKTDNLDEQELPQSPPGEESIPGVREISYKLPATRESAKATEAERADLNNIEAQTVMMKQSGAEHITADRVVMEQSGAKTMEAKSAQLDQSGVVALGSDHAVLMQSSAVQVVAEDVKLSKSSALFVSAKQAHIEDSSIVLFAGTADGDVKAIFTPTTAAVLGAAFGLIFALTSLFIRALSQRD